MSFSYLSKSTIKNYWQIDGSFRIITNYQNLPNYNSGIVPFQNNFEPFNRIYGFHIGAGVGYKIINKKQSKSNKLKYWQPTLNLKFAKEDLIYQGPIYLIDPMPNYIFNYENNYYYSAGLFVNNGRITKGKKFFKDLYWGIGFKVNYNNFKSFTYGYYSPDFFYNDMDITKKYSQFTGSIIVNLGLKFGKGI